MVCDLFSHTYSLKKFKMLQSFKYFNIAKILVMKLLPVSEDTHSKVMQYKAKQKLKTVDAAISKLLEDIDWIV